MAARASLQEIEVTVEAAGVELSGSIILPQDAQGAVIFAHGSGSSRLSPRNRLVAERLGEAGLAALLFDLLTLAEETVDERTAQHRFDINLLAERLTGAIDWARAEDHLRRLPIGLFGASTGAAAAVIAAVNRPEEISAVVSRGGRPDLAADALRKLSAPTLLIIGQRDEPVIELNEYAAGLLRCENRLEIIPGAGHLFEEPGTLDRAAELAAEWFKRHMPQPPDDAGPDRSR